FLFETRAVVSRNANANIYGQNHFAYELSAKDDGKMQRVPRPIQLKLTPSQRREIESLLSSTSLSGGHLRRVRVILFSADGVAAGDIANRLRLSIGQVSRIRARFERGGVAGLADRPRAGRRDHAVSRDKIELIWALAGSAPPFGRSRWSTRLIGERVGLS